MISLLPTITRTVLCEEMSPSLGVLIIILPVISSGQPLGEAGRVLSFNSGDEAVLSCELYLAPGTACDWTKDGWLLDMSGRYSTHHDCQLVISPVLPLDQGQFQCQVSGDTPIKSSALSLSVNTEPSQPKIQEAGDKMIVEVGEVLEITCRSDGAKPAADIEWWDDQTGQRIVSQVTQHVQRKPNSDSFISTSTVKLTVDSARSVKCSASNEQFPVKKFSEPLQLKLTGELTSLHVGEGDSQRLDCDRGRGEERYDWYINNVKLDDEHGQHLLITHFPPTFHGAVVACEVQGKLIRRFQLNLIENIASENTITKIKPVTETVDEKRPQGKIKSIYTCTFAEDEDDDQTIPSSVSLSGKPQRLQSAEDEFNRKFQCRRFSRNKNKFNQIQNLMKSSGSKIRKIYKQLNQML